MTRCDDRSLSQGRLFFCLFRGERFMFELQKIKPEIEIEGFNAIYYFEASRHYSHPPEQHDYWEMVYVDTGRMNAFSNNVGYLMEQGNVIFHKPMEKHAHVSDTCVPNNTMVVGFTSHSEAMRFFEHKIFTLDKRARLLLGMLFKEAPTVWPEVSEATAGADGFYFNDRCFGHGQLMLCYFLEFLIYLKRIGTGEQIHPNDAARNVVMASISDPMLAYMHDNLYTNLTMDDLSKHFLLGKTQLYKVFYEKYGKSPIKYYAELKIIEAKKLLREENYSVTQIADMLGYSSVHTFSRAFKNVEGFSPTDYLQSIR